jgi:2-aminoadipate transaminase
MRYNQSLRDTIEGYKQVSMSYKARLSDLDRDDERSLTQQIVDAFTEAIAEGELGPGDRLPPTRAVAEIAGVNHLTAARAYRRLAELGLVAGRVGSGTYVRQTAPIAQEPGEGDSEASADTSWQHYALPEVSESPGDRAVRDMFRHATSPDVLPLSVGYPADSLYPFEELSELTAAVLAEDGARALQYIDIEGPDELREQYAALMRRRGVAEEPDAIICTTGARQALTLVARAILRPGDIVACESPSFFGVIEAIWGPGARILPVPTDDDGLDTEALEALLRRHEIKLLALQPRLHNPTGRDLSPERRAHLIELARRHGFFIVEDGVYGDLRFEGEDLRPLRAEAPDHVVYVDSLTKTVGGGLRLGWVAASGPVLSAVAREKRGDDIHSATLPQLVGARFLAAGNYERHIADTAIPFYRERRDAMIEAVERELAPVASYVHPLGGGHLWVTLHEPLDERALIDEAQRQGVTFVPGVAMVPERPRRTHMRLSYGYLEPSELREAVRRLGVAIRALRREDRPARGVLPVA